MASEELIRAPVILLAKVAAALSRSVGDRVLAYGVVRRLASSHTVELVPVDLALAEPAAGIAVAHQVCGCDTIYVALAEQSGDSLGTLDEQQLECGAAPTVPLDRGSDVRRPVMEPGDILHA